SHAEREDATVPAEQPVPLPRRVRTDPDDRRRDPEAPGVAVVGSRAERDHTPVARRDPVAEGAAAHARGNALTDLGQPAVERHAGTFSRLRVAVTADVGEDRGLAGTVGVGTGGEWIDAPARALPREGTDERLDRGVGR